MYQCLIIIFVFQLHYNALSVILIVVTGIEINTTGDLLSPGCTAGYDPALQL